MQLLTRDAIANDSIIKLLAKWRKKHQIWFGSQFPVTIERTRKWLEKSVIDVPNRLLFIIAAGENNKYIGHVGLFRFNFSTLTCDIDNIVRGQDGYPGLMTSAVRQMMNWGRKFLGIKRYTLQTTSDNNRALRFYRKLGFIETANSSCLYKNKKWRRMDRVT